MRKALILLILLSVLLCLGLLACGNGSEPGPFDFNGSDPIVKVFRIGSTTVSVGETFNIPFTLVDRFTFELNGIVDPVTFNEFLNIKLIFKNITTGTTIPITTQTMKDNGYFTIYDNGRKVEYRLYHTMDSLWSCGIPTVIASPGDTIEVLVERIIGRDKKGRWFAYQMDKFYVVYTSTPPLN